MSSISANQLADMWEMGEVSSRQKEVFIKHRYDTQLDHDLAVLSHRHTLEEMYLEQQNSHLQPDCIFREYDWDAMYDEDLHCDDRDYISNLKTTLRKNCRCPDHAIYK